MDLVSEGGRGADSLLQRRVLKRDELRRVLVILVVEARRSLRLTRRLVKHTRVGGRHPRAALHRLGSVILQLLQPVENLA